MHAGDDGHYLSVGLSALQIMEAALGPTMPENILDLPSGYGRVTRTLRARYPSARITACDLDAEAVAFCAACFGARGAVSERDFAQLDLAETYDLLWVGSLITHLPPNQTRAFLSAMTRHMTARSRLVVSSHGPSIIPRLLDQGYGLTPDAAAAVVEQFQQTGFGFRDYSTGGDEYGVALTNENYGISLIGEDWFREALPGCGLQMETYWARRWDDHHDVVVARLAGIERDQPTELTAAAAPTFAGVLTRFRRWAGRT
jgi:SAM-dependent methyltransferase